MLAFEERMTIDALLGSISQFGGVGGLGKVAKMRGNALLATIYVENND